MTRDEFESVKGTLPCKQCGLKNLEVRGAAPPHESMVFCLDCNGFQRFLKKDRATPRRPPLPRGTLRQVWDDWGNHCGICGLSADELDDLRICRTVQHVPPFSVVGDNGYLIPFCDYCQRDSSTQMNRMRAMIDRFRNENKQLQTPGNITLESN